MPQLATLRKAPTVASRSPNGGLLLNCATQTQACIRAVYTGSAFESQWADATCTFSGKLIAPKRRGPKKKSGRGPPTSPTLRPRVLTPRDHFAHRGGGREQIMHNSRTVCNRKLCCFFFGSTTLFELAVGVCSPARIYELLMTVIVSILLT